MRSGFHHPLLLPSSSHIHLEETPAEKKGGEKRRTYFGLQSKDESRNSVKNIIPWCVEDLDLDLGLRGALGVGRPDRVEALVAPLDFGDVEHAVVVGDAAELVSRDPVHAIPLVGHRRGIRHGRHVD